MSNVVIQWSITGACSHIPELENLVAQQAPLVICLQNCRAQSEKQFDCIKGYTGFWLESENYDDTGEVVTLVSQSLPVVRQVKLVTKVQAIAVSVALPSTHTSLITICNIHRSSWDIIPHAEFEELVSQLPKPFVLMGPFYHDNLIEMFLCDNTDVVHLNKRNKPTYLDSTTGNFHLEDVTLATTDLAEKIEWRLYGDLCDSDHFPIILTFPHEPCYQTIPCEKWNTEDANWNLFRCETEIESEHLADIGEDIEFFTETLKRAGYASIMRVDYDPASRRRVRWWNYSIAEAVLLRKATLYDLRKYSTIRKLRLYRKRCAIARVLMQKARNLNWDYFTSSINEHSPMSANWRKVRHIKGINSNPPIKAIYQGESLVIKPNEIADVLASHYSAVSSNASYSPEFLEQKTLREATASDFSSANDELYNCPISMDELDYSLNHRNFYSAPGADDIHPQMLNNLHKSAKIYLLDIYNRIWLSGEFPPSWKLAIIVPTLKKDKERTQATSYRPVSLTSVLAKVFEKIIQKRLVWVLESKGYWSDYQYGFRKQRSAVQAVGDLQLRVKKALDEGCHLYAVFFDLQTASDTLWRHQILQRLHSAGIRGRMGCLIQSFLADRKITVRLGRTYSKIYEMENGLCQGSNLSETLLLVALNDIARVIKPPVNFALFVDDMVISYQSNSPRQAQDVLQRSIDEIIRWASGRGFKFSFEKTTCVDFYRGEECCEQPSLSIYEQKLNFSDKVSYLGLTFDSKLTWAEHIELLKETSLKNLSLLKKIDNNQKGADQKMLLRLYVSLIKSRMDYGSLAFGTASQNLLDDLDTIQNTAIQIAIGAYPTSPASSLSSISGIFPLHVSRRLLSANFLASMLSVPDLPLNKILFDREGSLHENSVKYLGYITANFDAFLPEFCEFVSNPPLPPIFSDPPPWKFKVPMVNLNLVEYAKYEDPDDLPLGEIYIKFSAEVSKYPSFTACYTDGSKTDDRVGAAFSVSSVIKKFRLAKQCSSFSAELIAIFKCLEYLTSFDSPGKFLIVSDSLNALSNLKNTYTCNPLLQRILILHNVLVESHNEVAFIWVPSHSAVVGNEDIDKAAREASYAPDITCPIFTSYDVKSHLKSLIMDSWQRSYEAQSSSNQLVPVKPNALLPASSPFDSKIENNILTRLRISHTGLTHSYLLEGCDPPTCPYCQNSILLIEHILTACPKLEKKRSEFQLPSSLYDLLNDSSPHINNLFMFLDSLNLLNKI